MTFNRSDEMLTYYTVNNLNLDGEICQVKVPHQKLTIFDLAEDLKMIFICKPESKYSSIIGLMLVHNRSEKSVSLRAKSWLHLCFNILNKEANINITRKDLIVSNAHGVQPRSRFICPDLPKTCSAYDKIEKIDEFPWIKMNSWKEISLAILALGLIFLAVLGIIFFNVKYSSVD